MSEQRPPSDDDLHAYLDGQLDEAGVQAVESTIAQNSVVADKIASFRAQRVAIKQLYDPVLDEPVPDHLRNVVRDARRGARRQTMMRIAASVVFLAVGAAGGWFSNAYFASQDFLLEPFVREAVLAHELATTEKSKGLRINKADPDSLSPSYLPADFGVPVKLPTLRRSELHPVALASGTGTEGSRVTVTYADRKDRRRTLFIRKFAAGNSLPVRYRTTDGFPVLYWLDGPLVYILVGEGNRKELISIAEEIYRSAAIGTLSSPQGQPPQGQPPQGQSPQGQLIQGQSPQVQLPQGQLIQGQSPQVQLPQGQLLQGQLPQGQLPQGQSPQGQSPQGPSK